MPAHINWNHDVEMEYQEMGERIMNGQNWEDQGFGALFDLDYELYMRDKMAREQE